MGMAKILIVDDSETVRSELGKALRNGGHEIIEAVDGNDGLAKAKATPGLQLIICDVNMPGMDGLTMCVQIQTVPALKSLPIFMLTTEANPELKAKGKAAGVKAWMVKPFNAANILAAIPKVVT